MQLGVYVCYTFLHSQSYHCLLLNLDHGVKENIGECCGLFGEAGISFLNMYNNYKWYATGFV